LAGDFSFLAGDFSFLAGDNSVIQSIFIENISKNLIYIM
jgi:hypothetical protein